jgi:hypothetical protein
MAPPSLVPCVQGINLGPEIHPEPPEIATEVRGRRIAEVQLSAFGQAGAEDRSERRRIDRTRKRVGGFRVKIAAEALELAGKHDEVGAIDLLRRIAPSWCRSTYGGVRSTHLVELAASGSLPSFEGLRGHVTAFPLPLARGNNDKQEKEEEMLSAAGAAPRTGR